MNITIPDPAAVVFRNFLQLAMGRAEPSPIAKNYLLQVLRERDELQQQLVDIRARTREYLDNAHDHAFALRTEIGHQKRDAEHVRRQNQASAARARDRIRFLRAKVAAKGNVYAFSARAENPISLERILAAVPVGQAVQIWLGYRRAEHDSQLGYAGKVTVMCTPTALKGYPYFQVTRK